MNVDQRRGGGFVAFFRDYTKTWVHAVSTAGLTAFGLLTVVNRWFVVLALAAYLVPPVVLYLLHGDDAPNVVEGRREADDTPAASPPSADAETGPDVEPERDVAADAESDTDTATTEERPSEAAATEERSTGDGTARPREWTRTDPPTDADLHDVALTGNGAVAVGDGGIVLVERDDEWTVALAEGPAAQGEDLVGVDVTADGDAVWVAGDSGALSRIDAETGQHVDYTAPESITDNWSAVAVGGAAGEETVLLANGSGQILRGEFGDDGPSWAAPIRPGSGSSISGVDLVDPALGYCCDTNDGVFVTTDGGESFETVGVDGADGTPTDLAATGREDCLAAADDGVVHRWDGRTWTPDRLFDDELTGVARWEREAVACGEDAVFERPTPTDGWERREFEDDALEGVDVREERAVAVGEDGAVVDR